MKIIKKDIDLLCWFDKKGMPHPIRFRLTDEEGSDVIIKVNKVIKQDLEKLAGNKMLVYTCQSVINNELKLLVLKYEIDTCKWMLFKI